MFQGDTRSTDRGNTVYCVYDSEWHESNSTCDGWVKSSMRMSKEDRIHLAAVKRETRPKQPLNFWLRHWKWIIGTFITLLGIAVAILIHYDKP